MKTSYFAKYKEFDEDQRLRAVSIAQGEPKYYGGRSYKKLAPSWKMIHESKRGNPEFYDSEYQKILDNLDPEQVVEEIGDDAILLCWEKPPDCCHRRWVAGWLEENLNMEVPELDYDEEYPYRKNGPKIGFFDNE